MQHSYDWKKFKKENNWVSFIPEFAKNSEGQEFMRPKGRSIFYRIVTENEKGEQTYRCANCNGEIFSSHVTHPIWDGPFPCSCSGRCHYENVPYCPKCEEKPSFHGTPIRVE